MTTRTINLRPGEIIRIRYRGTDALLVSVATCAPYTGRIAIGQLDHPMGYIADAAARLDMELAVFADSAERPANTRRARSKSYVLHDADIRIDVPPGRAIG